MFPEPILSSVDVGQRILYFVVVAKRLPRAVLEDSASESYSCSSRLHTCYVTSVTKISR